MEQSLKYFEIVIGHLCDCTKYCRLTMLVKDADIKYMVTSMQIIHTKLKHQMQ